MRLSFRLDAFPYRSVMPRNREATSSRFRLARAAGMFALASAALAAPMSPLHGQDRPPVQITDGGVLLDFQEADLRVVVSMLAELAGLTVSYSGLPSRPVTLRSATPVPRSELRGMLESIVRSNGLKLVQEGGFLRITAEEAGAPAVAPGQPALQAEATDGTVRLHVYPLRHARPEVLAETLRELFGLGTRTRTETPSALEGGAQARETRRQRLPLPIDLSGQSDDAPVAIAVADAVPEAQGLSTQVSGSVQIIPDPNTNTLLVRASAADYRTILAAIEQLDARPLQVLIEVLIAEVRRDRQFDLGIDASVPNQKDLETGAVIGGEIKGGSAGDVVLRVLGIGAVKADVILRALAASSKVNILSRPLVLAQNNQEARILVGSQRPFVQLFRALPTDAAVRDQVVQYRDVGTQLTIRPTINRDGYVMLNVLQEVSNATAETQFGAPVISTREAQTQLFIKDGRTAVIGGLIDQQNETGNSGIPILKDIPLIGNLFRSTRRRNNTTELFILLTPHVIRLDEDLDAVTRELRESTRDLKDQVRDPVPLIERNGLVNPKRGSR